MSHNSHNSHVDTIQVEVSFNDPRIRPGVLLRLEWPDDTAVEGWVAELPDGVMHVMGHRIGANDPISRIFLLIDAPDPDHDAKLMLVRAGREAKLEVQPAALFRLIPAIRNQNWDLTEQAAA